jgi:galactokinase/mevalonate kinase-like predicted kinase
MKNKTLRTNSMKLKKVIAASLAISVLFAFTGCGNSSSTDNTNTKQESSSTTETGSADELNKKRDDLYQQENQLFADHKDAWDKAFGLMNKNAAGDAALLLPRLPFVIAHCRPDGTTLLRPQPQR